MFCILDDDGKTVIVKNMQEFAADGKVNDLLVIAFLKQHARRKARSDTDGNSNPDPTPKPTDPPAKP